MIEIIHHKPSIKELRKLTKKTYWGGIQQFWHQVGVYVTWVFARTPITPNQITVLWVLIQSLAPLLFIKGTYQYMLIGILIYHFGFLVDCADGQLARHRKQYSVFGVYLDNIGHHISIPILFASLAIGVSKMYNNYVYLIFGGLAIFSFLFSKLFVLDVPEYAKTRMQKIEKDVSLKTKSKLVILLFGLIRVEHPLNILFWLILFGKPDYALILYSLLFFLEMGRKFITVLRGLRELDSNPKLKLRKNI